MDSGGQSEPGRQLPAVKSDGGPAVTGDARWLAGDEGAHSARGRQRWVVPQSRTPASVPAMGRRPFFYFKGGEKMEPVRFFYKRWRSSENTKYNFLMKYEKSERTNCYDHPKLSDPRRGTP